MPRQFGKVDESAGWPNLPCCPHRHKVSVPCPPTGVWLVLLLCHRCNPKTGTYCTRHRDRITPAAEVTDIPAPPGEDDEYRRRIGEEGAAA